MPSDKDKLDLGEEVVTRLTKTADTMAGLLDSVMKNHSIQSTDMDYFRRDLVTVRDAVRGIAKVLHEGNGEKPLIARVSILEIELAHLMEDIKSMELAALEEKRLEDEQMSIDKKGKWGVRVAIITASATLLIEAVRLLT